MRLEHGPVENQKKSVGKCAAQMPLYILDSLRPLMETMVTFRAMLSARTVVITYIVARTV